MKRLSWLWTLVGSGVALEASKLVHGGGDLVGAAAAAAAIATEVAGHFLIHSGFTQREAAEHRELAARNHHLRRGMAAALRRGLRRASEDAELPDYPYREMFRTWDYVLGQAETDEAALERFFPAEPGDLQWDATNAYRGDAEEDAHALAGLLRDLLERDAVYPHWSEEQALDFARKALPYYREAFADDLAGDSGGLLIQAFTVKGVNQIRARVDQFIAENRDLHEKTQQMVGELKGLLRPTERNIWSIPRPTEHFQDRPDLIAQIDAALDKNNVTALTALRGLGGIGKTQLARRFAELRRERYEVGVWIEAENETSLLASFSAVARLMGLPPEQDQRALAERVVNAISTGEKYLAVFDNAESPQALRGWLDRLSGPGHVLITSRNESWDECARPVSVTEFRVEEGVRFLLERTGQSDRGAAEGLAGDLGGLVLALEHAAAYMMAGDGMTIADYRRVWREKLRWIAKGHAYPDSVAAALGLSIDAVAGKSPAAYDLLCLFAWLAPDRIPRKELLEAGARKLPEALAKAFADREQWNEAIGTLGRYSLLRREFAEGVTSGYFVHRLVQQVVRDRVAADEAAPRWLTAACDLVNAAFPSHVTDELGSWPACEALLPHARAIREHVRLTDAPASLGRMLNQAGLYLDARGLYREARDFLGVALESGLRQLGPDHPEVAVVRSNLAAILRDLGEHAEARKQIEVALESDLRQLGPDHPTVAVHRSNLASILRDLGEHAEARKQAELALEAQLRRLGPDHPTVAVHRSNLASILRDLGEHAEARKQAELALESALRQLGPDHHYVAVDRSNLANILGDLGEHAKARMQVELALESDLRQLGLDHPNVAVYRSTLAVILRDLGEHDAALREIEMALEGFRKTLPPEHPHLRIAEGWREAILREAKGAAAN